MDALLTLLLNLVYGFLFFLAFAVFLATVVAFALATWQNVLRPLLRRSAKPDAEGR